ncbi:16S rRNA (cytosine(967)-C(5))-methyltransferase RsmB [Imhoffiella purpurea]|uniref:16S rRNA (cytosine(967)-C(5))-methyltransferase n=1 Tax=Imhoffiella purpurea TaxID=1249627 RepID=W9VEJ5_9GAMM|nr:16S rRNA (cytosine(967)-C(5))-methyltransferase RsmB [Imhoffiella purpurea]EXJ15401.1 Ribosomal RNA small subunit methyltransferase B [Imhoffiella purpurea]
MTERQPSKTAPAGARSRATAARAVHRVRDRGESLTRVMQDAQSSVSAPDQSLIQEMSYGTLRILPRLEAISSRLLNRPLKREDRDIDALILIGLYQLSAMHTPAHAAVSATVDAARLLGKVNKASLVNALLRRFLREREALEEAIDRDDPDLRWLFPDWLLERLRAAWPRDWQDMVAASNGRPPMSLRVNRLRTTPQAYAQRLAAADIAATPIAGCDCGLMLERPLPARELPDFDRGWVSIQDAGAQLAAQLLDAAPGQRVLDACAAPGGKTAAILERAGNAIELTAIDHDPARLDAVRNLLARLGLNAEVAVGDADGPAGSWAERRYDRILLDVPCSATGVIRRHPDIKWLRRASDIEALCETQRHILEAIWPLLAPGGRLLYATCSLLPEENQSQIADFLARHPEAREIPLPTDLGRALTHGRQLLPTDGGSDGFYYALIAKDSA